MHEKSKLVLEKIKKSICCANCFYSDMIDSMPGFDNKPETCLCLCKSDNFNNTYEKRMAYLSKCNLFMNEYGQSASEILKQATTEIRTLENSGVTRESYTGTMIKWKDIRND